MAHLASDEGHVLSLQVKLAEHVFVHLLHLLEPDVAVGIGFALMQQYALDDATRLCLSGTLDQAT